ncbi:MAG: trigger factor [Alphaproteobacteria bacterium]
MEVIQTATDGLKHEFKIVVDAKDIQIRIDARLEEIKKTANIPGFRPGKVPVSMLRKRYGDALRGEILEQTVTESSAQAIAENNLRPAMQPSINITEFEPGGNLEYSMSVEVMPEITLGDFSKIKLTRLVVDISDDDTGELIDRMAASEKNFVTVDKPRKAKLGDALIIDFVGSVDGVEFEGGSATDHTLELGANAFIDGFEDQLIGSKPGDKVTVNVTFPDPYGSADLAGKAAVFEVSVKELQEAGTVTIDDAFAQSRGFDDLAALRDMAKDRMSQDYAGITRSQVKRALLDQLADQYDFPAPPGMVDGEFEAIWKQFTEEREKKEMDPSDVGRDDDELREDYRTIAERRVRLGLLLSEVGRVRNVSVEQEEVNRAVMERAKSFPGQEELVLKHYQENPQALEELRAPLFEEKVVDLIIAEASVTDKKVSIEELMNAPEEQAPATKKKPAKKPGKKPAKKPEKKMATKKVASPAKKKPAAKKKSTTKKT